MNTKDITEKTLEDYSDVFADIINVLLFQGKRLVKPEELLDTTLRSEFKADQKELHEQERDVSKKWSRKEVVFALYGLENQTKVDQDMPLRVLSYDGASYKSELLDKTVQKRYPVITLVLYFGQKKWKGAKTLFDRVHVPKELSPYVNDYRINLYEIAYLAEEQINLFTSDFKIVAEYFVKTRTNANYVPSDQEIRHVDALLKLMTALTQDGRYVQCLKEMKTGEGGQITMCKVMDTRERIGRERGRLLSIRIFLSNGGTEEMAVKLLNATPEELERALTEEIPELHDI